MTNKPQPPIKPKGPELIGKPTLSEHHETYATIVIFFGGIFTGLLLSVIVYGALR